MKLVGKVAMITGGARGVGKAIALAFAREGANLIVGDRHSMAPSEETNREVRAPGLGTANIFQKDLADILNCWRTLLGQFGEEQAGP